MAMHLARFSLLIIFGSVLLGSNFALNKYSEQANEYWKNPIDGDLDFKTLEKPFRMAKLNLLWSKAQHRLTLPKLKSLFGELKVHDKEEITWKRLRAEGKDKEGMHEGDLRKKLIGIMSTYGLLDHFDDVTNPENYKNFKSPYDSSDRYINKSLFKDKKLNKLWESAEQSGFTAAELQALREEFNHHQDKIDQYYSLLAEIENPDDDHENSINDKLDKFNELGTLEEPKKDFKSKTNSLREAHHDIREGYDKLQRLTAKGPLNRDFFEPKVQKLWILATQAKFSPSELESLRTELKHYEGRILKLRALQAEAALGEVKKVAGSKPEILEKSEEKIKKHARKIEKLHLDLEARIMQKHVEL
ncbi:alpha-2-macroglobulin receptor-associated protein [Ischnura elegans]|uniref:alpha-2-macroglobulin receptor-associated protein n=1 Tax=Ischnura elegans TaxID=197161 RepID=UPI001ED8A77C|nr:alpha-2-macroglobulin receptor-associated protein [Ischnura elegans]